TLTVKLAKDIAIDSVTAGNSKLDTTGLTVGTVGDQTVITKDGITTDKVTVGNVVVDSTTNKISGLTAGSLAAGSTDAITGGQLHKGLEAVKDILGGNATNNSSDPTARNITMTNIGGTGKDNIHDAIQSVLSNGVQYDKNVDGSTNYNSITAGNGNGTAANSTKDATTGKITTTGGTSLSNVASAGDYTNVANASKAVNAGDLNNAVSDATNAATTKGFALQAADGNKVQKNLGEAVEVVGADSNITTKVSGGKVAIELNKNLNNLTGITVNNGTDGSTGSTVIGKDGISVQDNTGKIIAGVDNTALTVKDSSGNAETSINQAINTLNAAQGTLDNYAVKYDDKSGAPNKDSVTFAGTPSSSTKDATTGKITTTGGTSLSNVASAGDYTNVANASKAVNAGDLNNAVVDATGSIVNKGFALTAQDGQTVQKKLGESVEVVGDDKNISTEVKNGKVAVKLADNLNVNSLTTGDTVIKNGGVTVGSNVTLGNTGLIITNGPSVTTAGISAGNKTITNVSNGVNATDAVNKGQLDTAITDVQNKVDQVANNAVQYDNANKDSVTLSNNNGNGTKLNNVADGTVAQGSKDAVNGGQLWNVQQQVDKNTTDITNIQQNINDGKVGLVQQTDKSAPITVGKDTGGTSVSVAGTDGNRVVTGVKDGAVNTTSKDAVNGSQLNKTNQTIVDYLGGGAGYDNITGSFTTAPSYNVGGSSYNNVGSAIDALNQADQTLNSKIDNVDNKLDNAFRVTNNRIDDVEKKANAGIAAALAMESAPYVPGKYTYAAGAAYHGGENAVGVTLRKTADNGRWSITGGVAAASEGDPSVRIGISGVID
ncbi:YadA-like family protein, partial [Acinetobacter rongchengensis]|uniref:YadA-like family protein n=1 Tax=Acinetobacter rongchengensis TaxID=2419601 RepID=UPI001F2AEBCF